MSKASSMHGECFQPLKLFWHKDLWKRRCHPAIFFTYFHWRHGLLGRRRLFFEDWSAKSGASLKLVGQKAEENAALDENRCGNVGRPRIKTFSKCVQKKIEGKLLHEMTILSKKMAFTFPSQWPWTTSHSSGGKRWKRASKDFSAFPCAMCKNNFHGCCLKLLGGFLAQNIFHQPLHSCFFPWLFGPIFFWGAFRTPVFFIEFVQGTWCAERGLKKVT